jgi:hypothetical protein
MKPEMTVPHPWNPWPASIVAFFVVASIGCGTFVAYCNRHPADLVAADYYEQEVRYQKQMDRLQQTRQNARLASVSYDPSARSIRIALQPNHSGSKALGAIQLYRPSSMNLDQQIDLATDVSGVQQIDAGSLAPGLWKVRVSWSVDKQDYFVDQKVVVEPKGR